MALFQVSQGRRRTAHPDPPRSESVEAMRTARTPPFGGCCRAGVDRRGRLPTAVRQPAAARLRWTCLSKFRTRAKSACATPALPAADPEPAACVIDASVEPAVACRDAHRPRSGLARRPRPPSPWQRPCRRPAPAPEPKKPEAKPAAEGRRRSLPRSPPTVAKTCCQICETQPAAQALSEGKTTAEPQTCGPQGRAKSPAADAGRASWCR